MRLPSRLRALILLAAVLELPVLDRVVRRLTGTPRVELTMVGEVPVEVVSPAGRGPWPAWLFVNGAHPLRRTEPVVTHLSRGLARAGYLVLVPDLPGLGEGAIGEQTLDATIAVTEAALEREDVADGRIALIGASTGAALALLTAARGDLAGRISVVAAVAPFADLRRMICLATTGGYGERGAIERYEVADLQRRVVARSLVAALRDRSDRDRLLARLDAAERENRDSLEALRREAGGPSGEAGAVLAVLANEDPDRFDDLFEALPAHVLDLVERLSPVGCGSAVRAPVELVVPPSDVYFPPGEARALADALPNAHLTVTATLDHTRPQLSLGRLRDLRAFDRFVVRGLAAAASPP